PRRGDSARRPDRRDVEPPGQDHSLQDRSVPASAKGGHSRQRRIRGTAGGTVGAASRRDRGRYQGRQVVSDTNRQVKPAELVALRREPSLAELDPVNQGRRERRLRLLL